MKFGKRLSAQRAALPAPLAAACVNYKARRRPRTAPVRNVHARSSARRPVDGDADIGMGVDVDADIDVGVDVDIDIDADARTTKPPAPAPRTRTHTR